MSKHCQACGAVNPKSKRFCSNCGRVLPYSDDWSGNSDNQDGFANVFGSTQSAPRKTENAQPTREPDLGSEERPNTSSSAAQQTGHNHGGLFARFFDGGRHRKDGIASGGNATPEPAKTPDAAESASDNSDRPTDGSHHGLFENFFGGVGPSASVDRPTEAPQPPRAITKAEALKAVAAAATKAAAKSLALSAAVLGPGFVLLLGGYPIPGMIWLFLGSFGMVAWTYRKPWRVGRISALIPPLVASLCYAIQLALFGAVMPPILLLVVTILIGLGFGYLRAQTHVLTPDNTGAVLAERTIGFLAVWIASYTVTQLLALLAANVLIVRAGLLTGAFTTAALFALSWLLLMRSRRLARTAVGIFAALIVTAALIDRAEAQSSVCWIDGLPEEIWVHAGPNVDMPSGTGCSNASRTRCTNVGVLPNRSFRLDKKAFLAGIPRSTDRKPSTAAERRFQAANPNARSYSRRAYVKAICDEVAARFGHLAGSEGTQSRTPSSETGRTNIGSWFENLETLLPGRNAVTFDRLPPVSLPPAEVVAATAAVAAVLIAAGIAVNLAQAIAAALAQAMQSGVQLTSEEIQSAIAQALLRSPAGAGTGETQTDIPHRPPRPPGNAPPNVQSTERVRPPTPIYDEDGNPFETNDQGQYWGPDDKGNWRWLSRREAQEASDALRTERTQRDSEQAEFERRAERDREKWTAQRQEEARRAAEERGRAEAQRQAREQAMAQAERTRRENLTTSIFNALDNMEANDRYSELMGDFANAQQDGDTDALENIWGELRGERQQQLDQLAEEAAERRGEAVWAQRAETIVTATREGAKLGLQAGLGIATGGTATALQAGGAMVIGATALTGIGAVEGGLREKDGEVSFDSWEATRGAARGGLSAANAMVGGVAANGSHAVSAGKVVYSGVSTYGTTYADTMDKTGNRDLAANRAGLSAIAAMGGAAAGEHFDELSRLSQQRAGGMKIDAPDDWGKVSGQSWDDAIDAVHGSEKIRIEAGKSAGNLLANTLGNIASSDQDISSAQAFGEALKSEALGRAAGKIVGSADTGQRPLTGAQQSVIDRLNRERMGLSPQPKPTPEYEAFMRSGRTHGAGAQGASREDYVPVEVGSDYTGGFNEAARRHGQRVADNLGVRITARPVDPEGAEAIARGDALPKGPDLKANSGKDIDIDLGMDPSHRNRVVIFEPKLPPKGDRSDTEWGKILQRHKTRQDQYDAYAEKIRGSNKFDLRGDGLVVDRETGLPFAGDMDAWSVTGMYGEPVPKAVSEEAMRQLTRNPAIMGQNIASTVEHGEHLAWDIGSLDDTKIGPDGKTERQRAIDTNNDILSKLRPREGGPALAVFVPRQGMAPPRMEGAFYTGAGPDTGPKRDG